MRAQTIRAIAAASVLTACGSDPIAPGAPADHECVVDVLDAQPERRFPLGRTRWLPQLSSEGACGGLVWELADAPAGNANEVVAGEDGYHRFTPHVTGAHVFRLSDGRAELRMEVVDPSTLAFHNHSYHPSRSIVEAAGSVYVANAFTPSLTRLDPTTLEIRGSIAVGGWPVALAFSEPASALVVAQRGDDTLALVDVESQRIVDAVWVGDEPANVVLSSDGRLAYVALATEPFVVEVDVEARAVRRRLAGLPDQLGLAISPDDATVYVATHRSGHPERDPYDDDPVEEERDVVAIDVASGEQTRTWLDVGTTIKALHASADGTTLFVANLVNDTLVSLADPAQPNFLHQVVALELEGDARRAVVTSDADSSTENAITLHQMIEASGLLWVVAEGTDSTLGIDPASLEVRVRAETPGRPRALVATSGRLLVHGPQDLVVTAIDAEGTELGRSGALAADPRPAPLARGMRYFTGTGRSFARTWSCNSCHADSLTDAIIWNAGPLADRVVPRPFTWLEGAYPLGWAGYLSSVRNYAYTVNNNVGVRPTTEEALDLNAYISSLMPPPAANGFTRRDGRLSDEGRAGRAVYEGAAACAGCHALPLTTSRARFDTGITPGVSDVPILVGAYRHGVWMKHGEARTLDAATDQALDYVGVASLGASDREALGRFLRELTGRDFFLLSSEPRSGTETTAIDAPIRLTFSLPVWSAAENLARIRLLDADGGTIAASIVAEGRHVTLTPDAPLTPGSEYVVEIGEALEAENETRVFAAERVSLTTADAPALELSGEWVWTVGVPALDLVARRFDRSTPAPATTPITLTSTESGAAALVDYGRDLDLRESVVVSGETLVLPAMPVPIGPTFGDGVLSTATLEDVDGDGVADRARGDLIMQGPGFVVPEVPWIFERREVYEQCPQGETGASRVRISRSTDRTTISWAGGPARAVWITAADASLPEAAEGRIEGVVFRAIEATGDAFEGPLDLGALPAGAADASARHDAPAARMPEVDDCVRVTVVTEGGRGDVVMRWFEGRDP